MSLIRDLLWHYRLYRKVQSRREALATEWRFAVQGLPF